jgi:hypothetical protein
MQALRPVRGFRGALLPLLACVLAGCAGMPGATRPVSEIPSGDYDVGSVVSVAPPKQADGEFVAAVVYISRPGTRLEIWEDTYPSGSRGWLVLRPLGKGNGREHLKLVKSATHYQTVSLASADGQPVGYALLHKALGAATLFESGGKLTLVLPASNFIDPHYIGGSGSHK